MREAATRPRILSVVLAGGEGKRLMPLTMDRAKPAVPFGGQYRLIDFVLSNLANGGYRRIVVLTQYKSHSLDVHLARTWRLASFLGNYVTSVPAQMRKGREWFRGSADALYQNLNIVDDERPQYVFVFGADHVYRLDPRQLLDHHIESGAGVTVAALRVPREQANQFGVIERGAGTKISAFREKPAQAEGLPDAPDQILASMGNYVFTTEVLLQALNEDAADQSSRRDIGGNIIPALVAAGQAHVYDFTTNRVPGEEPQTHYWRDVGTLDAYHEAHMDLVKPLPEFDLYNDKWPIHTMVRTMPPPKIVAIGKYGAGHVADTMLCNGAVLSGATVHRSVLSPGVRVGGGATVEDSILLDDVVVGEGAIIRRAVLDKGVVIPAWATVGVDHEADRAHGLKVTEGGIVAMGKKQPWRELA
ncbi:MAG: glucose-1-phosphate adenylyltransferase [Myxococcales bacterium]|nr:glucose-1-phosphate adenylyltransferase [Myxococcales bacterium]MCB9718240.1 glucose-1-phosphate adenylyltransferase [Myxococcales bacterium]